MQHYFGKIEKNEAFLEAEDVHHLSVRRGEIGEEIEISDPEGNTYLCALQSSNPLRIIVKEKLDVKRESDVKVVIAFSLLKSDHNELIIQKCTELGASSFLPFISERSIVRPSEKEDNKLLRLRKIAKEAATQCRRSIIPEVSFYLSYKEVLQKKADHRYFAYEGMLGESENLFKELSSIQPGEEVLILIGPEGGFSDKEAALAKEAGFEFVSLGRRILRAETAAIYSTALLASKGEE